GVPDVEDTAADHMRRHRLDAVRNDLLLAVRDIGLAPAMETVLGLDSAEQQILRAAGPEDKGFDARNFHVRSPLTPHPSLDSVIGFRSRAEPARYPMRRGSREPTSRADRACAK